MMMITIRLRAAPFDIITVHVYAPTSDYDDNEIEEFYDQLQNVIDQTPKKGILVVQEDWNAKVGKDACGNWQGICGPFSNNDTLLLTGQWQIIVQYPICPFFLKLLKKSVCLNFQSI